MLSIVAPDATEIGIRLIDEAYMSWAHAQMQCAGALTAWADAAPGGRRGARVAYLAALDREEAAARDLERLTALVAPTPARCTSADAASSRIRAARR
jgi:hypothetical protein